MEGLLRSYVAIYVNTNVDTCFVCTAERSKTFGELRELLKSHHQEMFPNMGEVAVKELMVENGPYGYCVVDNTDVGVIFNGKEGSLQMNVVLQARAQMSLPLEGDALQRYSYPSDDNSVVVEVPTVLRAENAIITESDQHDVALNGLDADNPIGFQMEENSKTDDKNTSLTQERGNDLEGSSLERNQSSHPLDVYTDRGKQLKSKTKASVSSKSSQTSSSKADSLKVVTDLKRIRQVSEHFQEKPLIPSSSGCRLLPDHNTDAVSIGSEGSSESRWRIIGAKELESRKTSLETAAGVKRCFDLEEISGTTIKSTNSLEMVSNSKIKDCSLLSRTTTLQDHKESGLLENHGDIAINSCQLQPNDSSRMAHSHMACKDSIENKSTDMEMDNLIASLLSFTNAKPMPLEDGRTSACSMPTASLKTASALQQVRVPGNGSPKDEGISAVCEDRPSKKSQRHKKKKRKVLVEKAKKQGGLFADDFQSTGDTKNQKGKKYEYLQQANDKSNGKKVKHESNKLLGGEIFKALPHSDTDNGSNKSENKLESHSLEITVELSDMNAKKLKKRKNVKTAVGGRKIETEWTQNAGKTTILNKHFCSQLEPTTLDAIEAENLIEDTINCQKQSFSDSICKHENVKSCYLTPDQVGTRGDVSEKSHSDANLEDTVTSVVQSSRKKKGNKKNKAAYAATQQEKGETDGVLETESKNCDDIVDQLCASRLNVTPYNSHHANGSAENMGDCGKDRIEINPNSPCFGKTRLSQKKYLDKIKEDAINRSLQDVRSTGDNVSLTECALPAIGKTQHKEAYFASSEFRDEVRFKLESAHQAEDEMPSTSKTIEVRPRRECPCPAGCGRVFSGKTSSWYAHRNTCKGF